MAETDLLKFVTKGKTVPINTGIRTFSQQTYGVSRQSPDYFKRTHTIIASNTYHYQHQQAPQFEYHSQKKSLKLHPVPSVEIQHSPGASAQPNPYKFHLKKGRLTDFLDKNGWMNTVYVMSGHQRSIDSRKVSNKDRSLRVSKMKKRSEYQNYITPKPIINQSYYKTLQEIMSQRVRIRQRRLRQAQNQIPQTQRTISQSKDRFLDKQIVSNKMASTTNQWYNGSTFAKKREFSLREGGVGKVDQCALDSQAVDYERQFIKTHSNGFSHFRREMQNAEQLFNQ